MRPRTVQVVSLLVCAALTLAASRVLPAINAERARLTVMGAEKLTATAPPSYAFAIQALGAFRSLILNVAFIRFETLKEQGKAYDAMQLAQWICDLQPKFPQVWEFMSWNMAWNYSVQTYTPEERWNWVYNGVKLLRDQGIPYNPRAVNLYKQLAWTFINKMSEPVDDFHMVYKINWAYRMHLLFGSPSVDVSTVTADDVQKALDTLRNDPLAEAARLTRIYDEEKRKREAAEKGVGYVPPDDTSTRPVDRPLDTSFEVARAAARAQILEIVNAPSSLSELLAERPAVAEMLTALRPLGVVVPRDALSEDEYWKRGGLANTFFLRWRQLLDPKPMAVGLAKKAEVAGETLRDLEEFDRIVGAREGRPDGLALYNFLRRKVLTEVYRMDPAHMQYLIEAFGPMDWRSVDAAGLYWITLGLIRGGASPTDPRADKINAARYINFAMRNLWLRGNIAFEPNPVKLHLSYINLTPNPDFIDAMRRVMLRYMAEFDPEGDKGDTYRSGYINFMTEAIRVLYLAGRDREAARYYDELREKYPFTEEGTPNTTFERPLYEFVMKSYFEGVEGLSPRDFMLAAQAVLTQAFDALANGDPMRYARCRETLTRLRREFMEKQNTNRNTPPEADALETDMFVNRMRTPAFTPGQAVLKSRLWHVAPLHLRQAAYDLARQGFESECEAFEFDLARTYPEPAGMEQYRAAAAEASRIREETEKTADTPHQSGNE